MKRNTSQPTQIEPEFLSVADAEALSGLSRWTWRRMAYDRKVSSVKIGSRLLIPMSEIRRVMDGGLRPRRGDA